MNYRAMSREKALELFNSLFEYADRCSRFNCVDNILARNYLTEVFPYLETPPQVSLFYEVKADLTENELATLSKARVRTVQPGIESLATSTLKLMKKGTSAFRNLLLLRNCLVYDICPEWNLLIGFPGEGEDVYRKYLNDLPLLTHLPPPSGVFPVRFDRYSPYFVRAREYELDLHPVEYYELIYPFGEESLSNLAYYFTDRNLRAKYFLAAAKWMGKLRAKFDVWWKLWHDGPSYPELYLKRVDGGHVVHDTRTGELIEHPLSELALGVLNLMIKPQRIVNVADALGHLPGFDAAREVSSLQAKGLLFQEGELFLSLVLPRELPRLTFIP
jgi:magnesium-protoporphyrin IX monomethyl ester (oxidative) cyclase